MAGAVGLSACGGGRARLLKSKAFIYDCAECRRQTSVTAATIMRAMHSTASRRCNCRTGSASGHTVSHLYAKPGQRNARCGARNHNGDAILA